MRDVVGDHLVGVDASAAWTVLQAMSTSRWASSTASAASPTAAVSPGAEESGGLVMGRDPNG